MHVDTSRKFLQVNFSCIPLDCEKLHSHEKYPIYNFQQDISFSQIKHCKHYKSMIGSTDQQTHTQYNQKQLQLVQSVI